MGNLGGEEQDLVYLGEDRSIQEQVNTYLSCC